MPLNKMETEQSKKQWSLKAMETGTVRSNVWTRNEVAGFVKAMLGAWWGGTKDSAEKLHTPA